MRAAASLDVAMLALGCKGTIVGPLGSVPNSPGSPGVGATGANSGDGSQPSVITSQAAACSTGPKGRSYVSLDGHPLEQDRANVDHRVEVDERGPGRVAGAEGKLIRKSHARIGQ